MAKKALANSASVNGGSLPTNAKRATRARKAPVETVAQTEVPVAAVMTDEVDAHAAIAELAYGYWEARGRQGGSQAEDWFRAERAFYASRL